MQSYNNWNSNTDRSIFTFIHNTTEVHTLHTLLNLHNSIHSRMVMERHGFIGFDEKYTNGELWALVHFHAGGWRVLHIGQVVPPLQSDTAKEVKVL